MSKKGKAVDQFREYGRQGGLKGGPARMRGLNEEERSALGRAAAQSRWKNRPAHVPKPRLHRVVNDMLATIERTGRDMVLFRLDGHFSFAPAGSDEAAATEREYGGESIVGVYGPAQTFTDIVTDAVQD